MQTGSLYLPSDLELPDMTDSNIVLVEYMS